MWPSSWGWLTDKDIVAFLAQECYHIESDEPRALTMAILYLRNLTRSMAKVESGTHLQDVASGTPGHNVAWRRRHIFLVNGDHKKGLH